MGTIAEVAAQLKSAADIGAGDEGGSGAAEVIGFDSAQFSRFLGLYQVVDACTAAADTGFHRFPEADAWDGTEQLAGLGLDALAMNHVAGVMHGHGSRQGA